MTPQSPPHDIINEIDLDPVAGGFHHTVEADIAEIRNLLAGYAGEGSLLKELIQNAEDAGSKELILRLHPGDPAAPHPLLQTPALVVINDGDFTPGNFAAMQRASLGSKAGDTKSIGRFGKGLKSVFAISEAFFIFAQTDRKLGWHRDERIFLLNPWSHQRQSWQDQAIAARTEITRILLQEFDRLDEPNKPRLGLWLPLRHQSQSQTNQWIRNRFPAKESQLGDTLASSLESLSDQLILLRSLRKVSLWDDSERIVNIVFAENAQRMPDPESDGGLVRGSLLHSSREGETELSYTTHSTHAGDSLNDLTKSENWPKVINFDADGKSHFNQKDKGLPHVALSLVRKPTSQPLSQLKTRWGVFLPVRDQIDRARINLIGDTGANYSLFLHAYAFLDAQRTRIDGLDTNSDGNAPDEETRTKREWNDRLIRDTLLPAIPGLLHACLSEQGGQMAGDELDLLVMAFKKSTTWKTFQGDICKQRQLLKEITPEGVQWVASDQPIVRLPQFEQPERLFEAFPNLKQLREHCTLSTQDYLDFNALIDQAPAELDESQLKAILEVVNGPLDGSLRKWLNRLLPNVEAFEVLGREPAWANTARSLPLFRVTDDLIGQHHSQEDYWSVNQILETNTVWLREVERAARLQAAQSACPEWKPKFCDRLPYWAKGQLRSLGLENIARLVLNEPLNPDEAKRKHLLQQLKQSPTSNAIQALRYLVHGERTQVEANDLLLIQGPDDDSLIFEAFSWTLPSDRKWCLVSEEWIDEFTHTEQQKYRIKRIDASSLTQHLHEQQLAEAAISFPSTWLPEEYERLLQLIMESSALDEGLRKQLVRGLPIHLPLQGGAPVALTSADGTDLGYVLDDPEFREKEQSRIENSDVWDDALAQCLTIRRAEKHGPRGNQVPLFKIDENIHVLGWEVLAEACLAVASPERFATIIATALVHGSLTMKVREPLKTVAWLPLTDGSIVRPVEMIDLGGANTTVMTLFGANVSDSSETAVVYVPEQMIPEVLETPGFRGIFCNNVCHKDRGALRHVFTAATHREDLRIGIAQAQLPENVISFVHALKDLPNLPAATLLSSLLAEKDGPEWHQTILAEDTETGHPIFRAFTDSQRLLSLLEHLSATRVEIAFCAYLKEFVASGLSPKLLAGIEFRSQAGTWKAAEQLAWPSYGVVAEAQLCDTHYQVLKELHDRVDRDAEQAEQALDDECSSDNDFLKSCLETVTAELGSALSAAFVAILGNQDSRDDLVLQLLPSELRYDSVDAFRRFLLDGQHDGRDLVTQMSLHSYRFKKVLGTSIHVESIAGAPLKVSMAEYPDSLIVGDPARIFFQREAIGLSTRLDTLDREQLLSAVISAADTIIQRRILSGISVKHPPSVRRAFEVLADIRPDLRQAQIEIKLSLAERMRMIRIPESSQLYKQALRFDECIRLATSAEMDREANRNDQAEKKEVTARAIRKEAADAVVQLLRDNKGEASQAVAAVRKKMDLLKYGPQSVLPELFQNADDAYVENDQLGQGSESATVVLELNKDYLRFAHTGRPINNAGDLRESDRRRNDFKRDVVKMLTLNFSDKEKTENGPAEPLTGKFGLGFKSVYFLTNQPEVWSAPLRFSVIGGIYPDNVRFDSNKLEAVAQEYFPEQQSAGTVFHLPLEDHFAETDRLVTEFYNLAAWFLLFSKRVTHIQFRGKIEEVFSDEKLEPIQANDKILLYPRSKEQLLVLDCSDQANRSQAVLVLQDQKVKAPADTIARVWVTTPLSDAMEATWVINAPFEPDAGRSHISWRETKNRQIATSFADKLYERLLELVDTVQAGPQTFGTPVDFWRSMWKLLRPKEPCFDWQQLLTGGTIHAWLCWSNDIGAFRRLCKECAVIPTGLPGELGGLLKLDTVLYRLHGDFANYPQVLEELSNWNSFEQVCPLSQTVSSEVANDIEKAFPKLSLEEVRLVDFLNAELPTYGPIPAQAIERFQALHVLILRITDQAWQKRQLEAFKEVFQQCRFEAQNGAVVLLEHLLFPSDSSGETALLAAMAPESKVIADVYISHFKFLSQFTTTLQPDIEQIETWARTATTEHLFTVFNYLLDGDKNQALANKLKQEWFSDVIHSADYQQLPSEDQHELRRLFMSEASGSNLGEAIRRLEGADLSNESDGDDGIHLTTPITPEQVFEFWKTSADTMPYTLTGQWWDLLTSGIDVKSSGSARETTLRDALVSNTSESSLLWYRLFAIGTMMSANRRSAQLRNFLEQDDLFATIWNATSTDVYRDTVDSAFQQIINRRVPDEQASQENAVFWRRVFYDLRKMHYLIFENELHLTLMDLINQGTSFNQAATFLRSGRLRNGQTWQGVIGESMNGPILFILRELHRIKLYRGEATDPRPLFFSRYTTRAFQAMGFDSVTAAPGFDEAYELSEQLADKIHGLVASDSSSEAEAEDFLNAYDMPFIHYMLTH